ncbi:DUF2170 family protein [Vibrio marisflavi]|uniref:Cytoplasmic protein n=1 Tax=Vibrio marisflavi CECT 7928 TaxID=634439 RepID=A0ABM9A1G2_9VIBR|nr:DUF2170 family protein [Vibrio marisflavi]CAH0537423.1 hypothetical protein VMF7928_01102 [Vibrio marisflavi CECT 7928]
MSLNEINEFLHQNEHDWNIELADGSIVITNSDELSAVLVQSDTQILIESLLFPAHVVANQAEFDNAIMFEQKALPLSSVAKTVVNSEPYYCAFGALSSESIFKNIELEIKVLFQNVKTILNFSTDFLNV